MQKIFLLTFVFTPNIVMGCKVVNSGQVLELIDGGLILGNPKLVLKLARCRDPNTQLILLDLLLLKVIEWVRAACVRPHVGECDLFRCTLLEQEFPIGRPEHERREGTVQQTLVDVLH